MGEGGSQGRRARGTRAQENTGREGTLPGEGNLSGSHALLMRSTPPQCSVSQVSLTDKHLPSITATSLTCVHPPLWWTPSPVICMEGTCVPGEMGLWFPVKLPRWPRLAFPLLFFCTSYLVTIALWAARWGPAWFINGLIKPMRSSNLLECILLFNNVICIFWTLEWEIYTLFTMKTSLQKISGCIFIDVDKVQFSAMRYITLYMICYKYYFY